MCGAARSHPRRGAGATSCGRKIAFKPWVAVHTDEGLIGLGSTFTNDELVRAALAVLAPLYVRENALEPERVSEKLHQNTFWLGRGGSLTHAISGIDIALWDLLGQVTKQPVGRLLGGTVSRARASLCVAADGRSRGAGGAFADGQGAGLPRVQDRLGAFGRKNQALDEAMVRAAREAVGADSLLMVDAGGSDAFWPQGYKWAVRTAEMLADYDVAWFEEALPPDALEDYVQLRRRAPLPIAGGEVLTRLSRVSSPGSSRAPSTSCSPM